MFNFTHIWSHRRGFLPEDPPPSPHPICPASCQCSQTSPIPAAIRDKLLIPDHVEEARRVCVEEFVQDVLLPYVAAGQELTALELQRLALEHKQHFHEQHPQDFNGELELLPAAEVELMRRLFYQKRYPEKVQPDEARLVKQTAQQVRALLDTFEEKLYSI